jgi:phthalate 4,5-dioxygenase oxygenase subunit
MTAIGPGTLMGNLMRQYWLPALKSAELATTRCAPVRVMLLGEKLIAFRNDAGTVSLIGERCPHRGASLFCGTVEADGIRCAYHGWKFDAHGNCIDMLCEPEDSPMRRHIQTVAYPCLERGGIVWTYMGPRSVPPQLPDIPTNIPPRNGPLHLMLVECNWLQNLEGDIDLDHIPILHGTNLDSFRAGFRDQESPRRGNAPGRVAGVARRRARLPLEVVDSEVGCMFATRLTASRTTHSPSAQREVWAVGQFMMPFYSMLPYGAYGAHWVAARVPMDDHHTMTIGIHAEDSVVPPDELMFGLEPARRPDSAGWFGRFRLTRSVENDFQIDRDRVRSTGDHPCAGIGVSGQAVQDAFITTSMGRIADRGSEHLTAGDVVIVRARQKMLQAAIDLADRGIAPPGVDKPAGYLQCQGILQVRPETTWHEEIRLRRTLQGRLKGG